MDFEGGGLAHLDFLLRMDWGLCVVEVDEGAHCIREQADEAARMLKVRARHAKEPLRFVRYNPDCFGVSGQLAEVPQSERHARLRRRGHLHELEVGDLHQDPPARQHEPAQLHLELAAPAGQVAGVLASQMRTRSQFSLNLTKLLPRELVFRQDCIAGLTLRGAPGPCRRSWSRARTAARAAPTTCCSISWSCATAVSSGSRQTGTRLASGSLKAAGCQMIF